MTAKVFALVVSIMRYAKMTSSLVVGSFLKCDMLQCECIYLKYIELGEVFYE